MQSILIIQFRDKKRAQKAESASIQQKLEGSSVSFSNINALKESMDWSNPRDVLEGHDGIILGGSGDLYFDDERHETDPARKRMLDIAEEMRPFIDYLFERGFPTLGICLGHQLLAHALGNTVSVCGRQSKTGTFIIRKKEILKKEPLLENLPDEFFAQYSHKDVVMNVPKSVMILASSDQCDFAVLKFAPNIYSVQFHPELSCEEMKGRARANPEYLPQGQTAEEIFQESPHASGILRNFAKIVKSAVQA